MEAVTIFSKKWKPPGGPWKGGAIVKDRHQNRAFGRITVFTAKKLYKYKTFRWFFIFIYTRLEPHGLFWPILAKYSNRVFCVKKTLCKKRANRKDNFLWDFTKKILNMVQDFLKHRWRAVFLDNFTKWKNLP